MPQRLLVTAGPDAGRAFPLTGEEPLLVGRSKASGTRLTDPHVSRIHCQIQVTGGQTVLTDFESAAGTVVNGRRVEQHVLQPGDVISIGETQLMFESDEGGEQKTIPPEVAAVAVTPSVPVTELTGKTISRYLVGPVVARGKTGIVFRARDTRENLDVALKVLQPGITQNEDEMQRFVRAIKTMLPLRHPNLVAIYAAGRTGDLCWIAMEYVEGESLATVIPRAGVAGMLDWRYALRVAVHIARALQFAGEHHIIHRNISPHNILVRSSDKLFKLGDLMLAKALEGTMAQQITRPGEILGDLSCMSPERTQGLTAVDGRSDIYSLGATAYALLTGRPPFVADSLPETIRKIRQEDPVKPKKFQLSIPDLLEGAVLQMLQKRPDQRFQRASDALEQLERIATFQAVPV